LTTGQTDEYQLDFYAGQDSTNCLKTVSDGDHTAAAWSTPPFAYYAGDAPGVYVTPASLSNNAEGGAVDVTLTLTETDSSDCQPVDTPCK
jgi:hypothetical protein